MIYINDYNVPCDIGYDYKTILCIINNTNLVNDEYLIYYKDPCTNDTFSTDIIVSLGCSKNHSLLKFTFLILTLLF